jgi:monoamine oxidase
LLFRSLREPGSLRLNTVVERLEWQRGLVRIHARSALGQELAPLSARFCAITAPLGVLQSDAIRFDPEPPAIRCAIDQLAMGDVVRVTLRFRRLFWESREELKNASFLYAPDEEFPTWWTQSPVRAPVITAWIGGPRAAKYAGRQPAAGVKTALDAMSGAFQIDSRAISDELAAWHYHDWRSDPFSRGAYSYIPAGALDAIDALTCPVEDTLFFAGEASDPGGHWGTVHGAIRSAERAAAQIRAAAGR